MLISFSSRMSPAHSAKTTTNWFAGDDITVLDWPVNTPDLYCQKKDKRQAEGHYQSMLGFNNGSVVPQADHLHDTLH